MAYVRENITQDNRILLLSLGNQQKNSYNFIIMKMMTNLDFNILFEKYILGSYYMHSSVVNLEVMQKIENISVHLQPQWTSRQTWKKWTRWIFEK